MDGALRSGDYPLLLNLLGSTALVYPFFIIFSSIDSILFFHTKASLPLSLTPGLNRCG